MTGMSFVEGKSCREGKTTVGGKELMKRRFQDFTVYVLSPSQHLGNSSRYFNYFDFDLVNCMSLDNDSASCLNYMRLILLKDLQSLPSSFSVTPIAFIFYYVEEYIYTPGAAFCPGH